MRNLSQQRQGTGLWKEKEKDRDRGREPEKGADNDVHSNKAPPPSDLSSNGAAPQPTTSDVNRSAREGNCVKRTLPFDTDLWPAEQ